MAKSTPSWTPAAFPTFWINHTSRALMRRFEERCRPLGFGIAYLPVVSALDQHGSMQQKDLLTHVNIEQPTLTALLGRMERDGFIKRKTDPHDARARVVSLTPKAKATFVRVRQALAEVVGVALHGVSEPEQAAVVDTLKRIADNLVGEAEEREDPSLEP